MSKQHSKRKRTIKKVGTLKMKSIKLPKIGMRVSHLTEDKKSGPCRMVESYNTVKPW